MARKPFLRKVDDGCEGEKQLAFADFVSKNFEACRTGSTVLTAIFSPFGLDCFLAFLEIISVETLFYLVHSILLDGNYLMRCEARGNFQKSM